MFGFLARGQRLWQPQIGQHFRGFLHKRYSDLCLPSESWTPGAISFRLKGTLAWPETTNTCHSMELYYQLLRYSSLGVWATVVDKLEPPQAGPGSVILT